MTSALEGDFQKFLRQVFSPDMVQTMESWWRKPIITDPDAFRPVLSEDELKQRREQAKETRESLNLPRLIGCSMPSWNRGKDGSLSVHKTSLFTDILDGDAYYTGASEAIASTLARHVGVLVPPVQVWKSGRSERPEDYSTASLRIFSDARDTPPDHVLANNAQLAQLAPFDTWINNPDRKLANLIYGTAWQDPAKPSQPPQTVIAGVDHAFLHVDWTKTCPIFRHHKVDPAILSPSLWRQVRDEITASAKVQSVIKAIENTPDAFIKTTVSELPDALYPTPAREAKAKRIDVLRYRRDNISQLTLAAAGIT